LVQSADSFRRRLRYQAQPSAADDHGGTAGAGRDRGAVHAQSPSRAAGKPPIITVTLPIAIPFGAGDTQAIPPGMVFATAAGVPPINTVGTAAGVIGPPTCGLGPWLYGTVNDDPCPSPTRRLPNLRPTRPDVGGAAAIGEQRGPSGLVAGPIPYRSGSLRWSRSDRRASANEQHRRRHRPTAIAGE
jgi:hypothetical protein